jgi:D-alanyl-D-alanine carboxypeptidase
VASAAVDLDHAQLAQWTAESALTDILTANALLSETERLAVRFGIQELTVKAQAEAQNLLRSHGYRPLEQQSTAAAGGEVELRKSLHRRQTRYGRKIMDMHRTLGIPRNYGRLHRIPLQVECSRLASIGPDIYGREQKLHPRAARAWRKLHEAALDSGIEVQPVSAWRSVDYQQSLLQRKLDKGLEMAEILRVSAAPGFSEHHTGRAIDVTTPGFAVLEEEFEGSKAFAWMKKHASEFGFRLSFPRRNHHKLSYEPWHWCFVTDSMQ